MFWGDCDRFMLHSHDHYKYTYTCRNIFNTIRTSEDSSLEKYTSHFIWKGSKGLLKVLLCERWVGDWTELQHIDPHTYGHNRVSFPFSWDAQPGAWGPSLFGTWFSFQHLLTNWLELPVYRVILLFYADSIQTVDSQAYPLETFDRMHLLFTQVHFLFWLLGQGK